MDKIKLEYTKALVFEEEALRNQLQTTQRLLEHAQGLCEHEFKIVYTRMDHFYMCEICHKIEDELPS